MHVKGEHLLIGNHVHQFNSRNATSFVHPIHPSPNKLEKSNLHGQKVLYQTACRTASEDRHGAEESVKRMVFQETAVHS